MSYDRTYPRGSILEIAQSTDLLICSQRLVIFVSHILYLEYFVLRVFFFVMEGMEVSGGTRDDGDHQDASLSLQIITTGAATYDPASPSSQR